MGPTHVCTNCETPLVVTRTGISYQAIGITAFALLLFFIAPTFIWIPVLILAALLWLIALASGRCSSCGSRRLIPAESPAGKRILGQ